MALTPLAFVLGWAQAHTLDEVMQGAYLTLAPGEVRLQLDVTVGTEVAGAVMRDLDHDADRTITEAEAQSYGRRVLAQSILVLDGATASWRLGHVSVPPYPNLELGSDTIKIQARAERPDNAGTHTLRYENRYEPAASRRTANLFMQLGGGWRYRIDGQQRSDDGRQLTVLYTVVRQDR